MSVVPSNRIPGRYFVDDSDVVDGGYAIARREPARESSGIGFGTILGALVIGAIIGAALSESGKER